MTPRAGVVDGLLAGRYRLVHRIAAGGMGEVWRARDVLLHRDVAAKGLRPELVDDLDVRARFRAEAHAAARLAAHPSIAAVYDFVEDDDGAWLVMELVDGEPLSTVLRREGRLTERRTLDVVEQTAGALSGAHDAGVVHRDIKPGNLLVSADGTVSVTDFGIASAAGAASLTRTGELVGTAGYLSPEQASGGPATVTSDLYALGVVAYECLAGHRPFDAENPVAVLLGHLQTPPPPLPAGVDERVRELVLALLAKDPGDRPQSAAQLAARAGALRDELDDEVDDDGPAVARPVPAPLGPVTQALPVVDAPEARPRPRPGAAATPARGHSSSATPAGLAGRPGQRRAVRVTALVLGLLAVGLGARGAFDGVSSGDGAPARPTPSPTTPSAASPAPSRTAATAVPDVMTPAVTRPTPASADVDTDPGPARTGTTPDGPALVGTAPAAGSAPADQVESDVGRGNGQGTGQGNGVGRGPDSNRGGNGGGNGRGNPGGNGGGRGGGG